MKTMSDIRLIEKDIQNIILAFKEFFLEGDQLWIFGSRVYTEKRGGDIDLYVETQMADVGQASHAKRKFWGKMQDLLGEQ